MTTLYEMTPREIVAELDKYIIGQDSAKRSVAVALRNRYRRSQLPEAMRDEVTPKNIRLRKVVLDTPQRKRLAAQKRAALKENK